MAQYNAIKAAVNAYIKANGRKEITGQILNSVLNATIDSLGRFFQFAGEARPDTDPGTPDQNVTYLAGVPGTYTHFNGLVIDEQEIALLMWNGEWVKHTMLIGIREVVASVDNQVGTPSVDVNYDNAELSLAFHNMKGDPGTPGAAAGFGSVTADVDANIGTPGVSVVASGSNTSKNFAFHFTNLKGQKGDTGVTSVNASVDGNTGVPYVEASLSGQVLTLAFHNMKGQQGDTGSSVDYPYTLVNNVTTNDATQGLAASMGVYLQAEIDQLELQVDGLDDTINGADNDVYNNTGESAYYNTSGSTRGNYGLGMVTPIIASPVKFNVLVTPFVRGKSAYTMKYAIVESSTTGAMTPSSQTIIQTGTIALSNVFSQYVIPLSSDHTTQANMCIALLLYSDGDSSEWVEIKGSAVNDQYNADTQRYLLLATSGLSDPFSVAWSRASSGYYAPAPTLKFKSVALTQEVEDNKTAIAQLQSDVANPMYFRHEKSVNLFNYFSQDNKSGGYYNSNATFVSQSAYMVSHPIFLRGGVTYKAVQGAGLGASSVIAIVDESNNVLGKLTGIVSDGYITITPPVDLYASFNCGNDADTKRYFMVCENSEYPAEFVAFYDYVKLNDAVAGDEEGGSRLVGKSVIFAGDSICANANGYPKLIGEKNKMNWRNEAVSGATIIDKDLVGSSFTISETDFGDGADYIILEGGTNDADRIGSILNGGEPQYYGSYDLTDYTTEFQNSTFCSAVEMLIQRVVSGFPSAHIGFIIAPKMGVTSQGYTKETNNRRAYFETIIQICHKWGVPVLNLWDECTMNPRIASHYTSGQDYLYIDGQHPTAHGYDLMTPFIEEWMKSI